MNDLIRNAGPHALTKTWYVDGTPSDVGAVTVTVTDANGTETVSAAPATNAGDGIYTYSLASQPALGLLRVVWTRTGTGASLQPDYFEVVGNVLFTEVEARNVTYTGMQTPLASAVDYPDAAIHRVRRLITEQFEDRTGRAWTRRYARARLGGRGGYELGLWDGHYDDSAGNPAGGPGRDMPAKLISVSVSGVATDLADVHIDGGVLRGVGGWPYGTHAEPFNIVAEWEYGPDPVPMEANEHGLRMAVASLVPSDTSGWAQTFSGPDGTVNYGAHGLAYPSKVWEWLKTHPRPPAFA